MVDFNALPAALKAEINRIKGMEGDSNKIDSYKEYEALGELLNGGKVSGNDQKAFIEEMMFRYEESDLVSPQIRERVREIIRNADATKADDNLEVEDLKKLLKTKGLSNEDKKYIKDVIKGRTISLDASDNKESGHGAAVQGTNPKPVEKQKESGITKDGKGGTAESEPKPEKKPVNATGNGNYGSGNGQGNVGNGVDNTANAGRDVKAEQGSAVGNGNKTAVGNNNHQAGTANVNGDNNSVSVNARPDKKFRPYWGL